MPDYFDSETNIEGMLATDIFSLNTPLAATIEEQVVSTLNRMRPVWDPMGQYQTYSFTRQSQTFPDVLFRKRTDGQEVILGIELKGWYLLAKEGMPSYRFTASPDACAPADMIVVIPWALSNVLSGTPVAFPPFIESARYVAEYRNHYWQYIRTSRSDSSIILSEGVSPYPSKNDRIADKAASDSGNNFGRIARYGVMKDYIDTMRQTPIRGIPAIDWSRFFGEHGDSA